MRLELDALAGAAAQLEKSLAYAGSAQAGADSGLAEQFRNSVIQCFEFTYELAWKMLRRQLALDLPTPELVERLAYRDLVRTGVERGLLREAQAWFDYRELRNQTAHTDDASKADKVAAAAPQLLADVQFLLAQLRACNGGAG
ncbi:MAG: HI0074 family nucleotidyltransferase substrate-binding subunit [Lentisphaeria bacterium]